MVDKTDYTFKDVLRSFVNSDYESKIKVPRSIPKPPEKPAIVPKTPEKPVVTKIIERSVAKKSPIASVPPANPQNESAIQPAPVSSPVSNLDEIAQKTNAIRNSNIDKSIQLETRELEILEDKMQNESAPPEETSEHNNKIGSRLIRANLITQWQRSIIVNHQRKLLAKKIDMKFGELAIKLEYCTAQQIEEVLEKENLDPSIFLGKESTDKHWMGSRLITSGLITPTQRDHLVKAQKKAARKGKNIRIGELAISHNLCTESQIQNLIDERSKKLAENHW